MLTVSELLDEIYNAYMKEVEEAYNDPALYERFVSTKEKTYSTCFDNYKKWVEKNKKLTFDSLIAMLRKNEHNDIGALSIEERYKMFTPDQPFEEIKKMSQNIFAFAIHQLKGGEVTAEELATLEQNLVRMRELESQVEEDHQDHARLFISEATVEVAHMKGETPYYSLRLGERVKQQRLMRS